MGFGEVLLPLRAGRDQVGGEVEGRMMVECCCAAFVYSLVSSCKAMGVDPREWMEDVMLRIPGNENNRDVLRDLLPDKWAKQTN